MLKPSVSVVMPVFNQQKYVCAAVDSVLAQTFSDFEFVIVDDGSTDGTVETLRRYSDPRIVVITSEHRGFIAALTLGFRRSRGEWVARMDSDDVCAWHRLARQVAFVKEHPECVFVGSLYGFTTPNGGFARPSTSFDWRYVAPRDITVSGKAFGDPTVLFHKGAAERVGYYDEAFENENPLWYRLLGVGRGAVIGECLYYTRWLAGSVSRSRLEHWHAVHHAVRRKYDPANAAAAGAAEAFSPFAAATTKLTQGVHTCLCAGDRKAALSLAWSGWTSGVLSWPRGKLLAYAILGIDGIRTKVAPNHIRLERCAGPASPG